VRRCLCLSPVVLLILAANAPAPVVGGEASAPSLASFDALQKRLGSPGLRLLDVRPKADYDEGHLRGAVWVDSQAVRVLTAKPGGLGDRVAWQSWIAPLGIGPDTEVLIADGGRQLDAARLWWLLSYLGVEKVGLIDGNVALWSAQGRPVTREVPKVEPASFRVQFRHDRLANRADVARALAGGKAQVVDARTIAEYTGERRSSKRGGHIPTACRLEWSDLVGQDGRFLAEGELRSKVEGLGLKAGEPVITHCQGGGWASVDAFVLERLGHKARNYYLGWSDWGNADDTPVVEGTAPGTAPSGR
jgi:thiosulfate/3-mercaptopyruvate sulfurtransferase